MRLNIFHCILLATLFSIVTMSCDSDNKEKNDKWVLVWQDEFNEPTADNRPDPTKWTYDIGASGWGNQEWQFYTDRVENASLVTYEGLGCLKITAIKENYGGADYTSARLKTQGIFEQTSCRF